MRELTTEEAADRGVDPERSWLEIECPHGHQHVVENHEGGSAFDCGGGRHFYGDAANAPEDDPFAVDDGPDVT